MTESTFQSKIIKSIEGIGGVVVNGTYSKKCIADLICGYPVELYQSKIIDCGNDGMRELKAPINILIHLHIEVKTKDAYEKLMRNNIKEVDGLYVVEDAFKGREKLQAHKLNDVRKRGGLALFAYSFKQVEEYINENTY